MIFIPDLYFIYVVISSLVILLVMYTKIFFPLYGSVVLYEIT